MLPILFAFALILIPKVLPAQYGAAPALPLEIPDSRIKPFAQLADSKMQIALDRQLRQNKNWARLINKKKMAVGIVDLSHPQHFRFAQVNGHVMMYAASLPKLAVLLAAYQAIENGTLVQAPEVMYDLRIMISKSDNLATTRMIDRIGGLEKVQSVIKDKRYCFYDENNGGGLWIGRYYEKESIRIPEPIKGLSHAATVLEVCRFYYSLTMGKLINHKRSAEMLAMLRDPEVDNKFAKKLREIAPEATLYRKSGTWLDWHSDSVLVWGSDWRRYILVALTEAPDGEQILLDLVPAVEEVLKSQPR